MTTTAPTVEHTHQSVSADVFGFLFSAWRAQHAHGEATSPFDPDGDPETRYYVDGFSGYAVRPDGELTYVHSWIGGQGDRIVQSAIANGAVYLDCFDGHLTRLYSRHGFKVADRVANWTPGEPDVVYMALPGYADRHGVLDSALTTV